MRKSYLNLAIFWVVAQLAVILAKDVAAHVAYDFHPKWLFILVGFLPALPWLIRPLVFDTKFRSKVGSLQAWGYGLLVAVAWILVQSLVSWTFAWLSRVGLMQITSGGVLVTFISGWWLAGGICLAVLYRRKNVLLAGLWLAFYQIASTAIQMAINPRGIIQVLDLFTSREGVLSGLLSGLAIAVAEWIMIRTERPANSPVSSDQ